MWQNDASNAFNSVSRDAIKQQLQQLFPEILPFFDLCYETVGQLRIFRADLNCFQFLRSAEGTQQGDPLGPFLFALAIQPILSSVAANHPATIISAFVDDITLIGNIKQVAPAVADLQRQLRGIGLETNAAKCLLYSKSDNAELRTAIASHNIALPKFSNTGFRSLGSPVGHEVFETSQCNNDATDIVTLAEQVAQQIGRAHV